MRRNFTKFPSSSSPFVTFTSSFSTSSSGRGRGRGLISPKFNFVEENPPPPPPSSENKPPPSGFGHGHVGGAGAGRGQPFPSTQTSPSSTVSSNPGLGRGRGLGPGLGSSNLQPIPPPPPPLPAAAAAPQSDTTTKSARDSHHSHAASILGRPPNNVESNLSANIFSIITGGAGRGKVPNLSAPSMGPSIKPKEENRHIRHRQPPGGRENDAASQTLQQQPFNRDNFVRKAGGIQSRDGEGGPSARGGRGGGFRGGRGRGMWRGGRGSARGRGRGNQGGRFGDDAADDDYGTGLYLGDDAHSDRLAERLGPDVMSQLAEGFEELADRVLPSPIDDAYEDALRTNFMIECEPEYQMGNFLSNPDIDEKPQIPLREALEKMKPVLMPLENIRSQEEWEEAVEEVMEKVPVLKEIVDVYGGPDRVTAKQQQQELERVAEMIPERAPPSIKRFTNNVVLSLQSNPGWGFDKKCQLMDKLVQEVSQQYK